MDHVFCLRNLYEHTMEGYSQLIEPSTEDEVHSEPKPTGPKKDTVFNFDNIKSAINRLNTIDEKRILLHEIIFDLEEWKIKYDVKYEDFEGDIVYKYAPRYYPNFEELCNNELERLDFIEGKIKKTQIPVQHAIIANTETETQRFAQNTLKWSASDTDLLELLAALHKSDSIKRKDGKPLSRKELIEYFQNILGIEIKNMEVKLSRATSRNDKTPFLDKLVMAFENYGEEKEEKQRMRR